MWNPALKSAASFSRSRVAALQHNFLEIGWTTVLLRVQGMEVNKELKVDKAHATLLHLEGRKKYGTPESQAPKLQNKAAEQPRRLAILQASGNLRKACLQLIACLCYPTLHCHRSRLSQLSSFLGGFRNSAVHFPAKAGPGETCSKPSAYPKQTWVDAEHV